MNWVLQDRKVVQGNGVMVSSLQRLGLELSPWYKLLLKKANQTRTVGKIQPKVTGGGRVPFQPLSRQVQNLISNVFRSSLADGLLDFLLGFSAFPPEKIAAQFMPEKQENPAETHRCEARAQARAASQPA